MNQLINITHDLTMSSLEIAGLTDKRHDHVMRDIKSMLEQLELGAPNFEGSYKSAQNKDMPCYNLPKRECLILVSGYSISLRVKIIDRWQELESQQQPKLPMSYKDALLALIAKEEALEQAIKTKAEIGSRREATSMATASIAVKKANKLEIEMDKHQEWASVLRVEQVTGKKYSWKPLKEYCLSNNLEIKKVNSGMDTRFSTVNTYPSEAWYECYSVDITEFK